MDPKTRAVPSARWDAPEYSASGKYWTARLRDRLSPREERIGAGPDAHGPTEEACVAETARMDRAWVAFPNRTGDDATARDRARYLAGGDAE